jgi:hypothetical protein
MESRFSNSCIRLFVLSAIVWFSAPLFAADRNFTEDDESTFHNACERLLEADLSGYFVATNAAEKYSQLVQLRRLGATSAYTISRASFELAPSGIRELEFVRTADGWKLGDPGKPDAQVNIVTILRDRSKIVFKFENANDPHGFPYEATPAEDLLAVQGDILHPDQWMVRFESAFAAEIKFTRVKLDRSFELAVSQPLKSLLATRLDDGDKGIGDYMILVQFKKPLMADEAEQVLGTKNLFPLDENSNGPYYRYAVPRDIFALLEDVGHWTRSWQVAHIDAVPMRLFDLERIRSQVARTGILQPAQPQIRERTLERVPSRTPRTAASREVLSSTALDELASLSHEVGPGPGRTTPHEPRDLDQRDDQVPGQNHNDDHK